ncbi:Uncharacterised protein g10876 [Pycnogonum litorale]
MMCAVRNLFQFILHLSFIVQQVTHQALALCPIECYCTTTRLSHTSMIRCTTMSSQEYLPDETYVTSAVCIVKNETSLKNVFEALPTDLRVLTIIQSPDSDEVTISDSMLKHLKNLTGIRIQGAFGKKSAKYKLRVHVGTFDPLRGKLKYLIMDRVEDALISVRNLTRLECLHLIQVETTNVTWRSFDGLHSLSELVLEGTSIMKIRDFTFYSTPNICRLYLANNKLETVEAGSLVGLMDLVKLDVSNNNIGHVSGISFPPMPKLEWLSLWNNPLTVIFPRSFQFLNATKRIVLGHPKQPMVFYKYSFTGLSNLLELFIPNVGMNQLQQHMFHGLRLLKKIKLSGTIHHVGAKSFRGADKLYEVMLAECKLKRLHHKAFYGLKQLVTIDLSKNEIANLPPTVFGHLRSLRNVILTENRLHTLPENINRIPLNSLRLDGNPWNCTCREMLSWKRAAITQRLVRDADYSENTVQAYRYDANLAPKCKHPKNLRDKTVYDFMNLSKCAL